MAKFWITLLCLGLWAHCGHLWAQSTARVWVDTDNRLGRWFRDVDDYLALNYLIQQAEIQIEGISLVRGGRTQGQRISRRLVDFHQAQISVYQGALHSADTGLNPAVLAMIAGLEKGKMRIFLLGPATNAAILLRHRPDLSDSIEQLIFCGGRSANSYLQPNPDKKFRFKDANFDYDPAAFSFVFGFKIPLVLAGYEAAYPLRLSKPDLQPLRKSAYRFERRNYRKIRRWAWLWANFLDMNAFIPFDVATVAYLTDPTDCRCEPLPARITWRKNDAKGSYSKADFKHYLEVSADFEPTQTVIFCTGLNPAFKSKLLLSLSKGQKKP